VLFSVDPVEADSFVGWPCWELDVVAAFETAVGLVEPALIERTFVSSES
jgi:hypothetical protein